MQRRKIARDLLSRDILRAAARSIAAVLVRVYSRSASANAIGCV
jgi:hypothetical protein